MRVGVATRWLMGALYAGAGAMHFAATAKYVHIMPVANMDLAGGPAANAGGKTTSVHLRDVIGCKVARKHPKTFRLLVYREKETKRYDFEARNESEAAEIVGEIKKNMDHFRI